MKYSKGQKYSMGRKYQGDRKTQEADIKVIEIFRGKQVNYSLTCTYMKLKSVRFVTRWLICMHSSAHSRPLIKECFQEKNSIIIELGWRQRTNHTCICARVPSLASQGTTKSKTDLDLQTEQLCSSNAIFQVTNGIL